VSQVSVARTRWLGVTRARHEPERPLCLETIAPPFHDGSNASCGNVARHLTRIDPVVLSTPGAPPISPGPAPARSGSVPAYGNARSVYACDLGESARAGWLLLGSRASVGISCSHRTHGTSSAGRLLSLTGACRSCKPWPRPRAALTAPNVCFSETWSSRKQLDAARDREQLRAGRAAWATPVRHCAARPRSVAPSAADLSSSARRPRARVGQSLRDLPGDLETSSGCRRDGALAERLAVSAPELVTVFAYRRKSLAAAEVSMRLSARLARAQTRFVEKCAQHPRAFSGAAAVVFPVDDLWGKVDLPSCSWSHGARRAVLALDQAPQRSVWGGQGGEPRCRRPWCGELNSVARRSETLRLHRRPSTRGASRWVIRASSVARRV